MTTQPQPPSVPISALPSAPGASRDQYRQDFLRVQRDFEAAGSGLASLSSRTRIVDRLALTVWEQQFGPGQRNCALIATGGFGRSELFPYSDVDLLFLTEDELSRDRIKDRVTAFCQTMWDCGLRVSPTVRTLTDCGRFEQNNLEFTLSLLDCRFLAGDSELFAGLHARTLPQLIARDSDDLLQRLSEMTRLRHERFAHTIFHLEPNLKDGPGGLRDCHVTKWIGMIAALAAGRRPDLISVRQNSSPSEMLSATEFLCSTRCHLHYRHGRDDNTITWAAQEELAARGIATGSGPVSPSEWMRLYFRHAKAVYRNTSQLLALVSQERSSLYRSFQHWRSRVSNSEFSVLDGRVFFQQSADTREAAVVLRLFTFLGRHGFALSADAERRLNDAHVRLAETMPQDGFLWQHLREILTQSHAADALRTMHSLNLLTRALPEFEAIDLLVLRDLYHRYTVDEHTFTAIGVLHQLEHEREGPLQPFAQLISELEHPELLFLALLLHDTGKGLEGADHVHGSLQLAASATERMQLSEEDAATVCFLIAHHLEISSTMRRRDIYDPTTVRELAAKIGTPERMKMLTLMTLADIKAVNPEALTPWKAENLWRLYTRTASYFDRSADDERLDADASSEAIEKIVSLMPARRSEMLDFLDGLPQRYVLSHSAEEVVRHFALARRLAGEPVQLAPRETNGHHVLTVVTTDRPGLFRTIAGILYAWGMDISKAAAFSNRAGTVVDVFHFRDRFQTLELNPPERERFQRSVREVLMGEVPLEPLVESRLKADQRPLKLTIETRLRYDNDCSMRSTMLEVVTQDRPGLLHTISSALTAEGCSIEIALIDTEGPVAHDVFYITFDGQKLGSEKMRAIEWSLTTELADALPSSW
ncbi:MAG TPA: [protein-PII] uridylyltransferase [Terriglobales bacterium]|jgi:[protein-PII] uridylyltransferase|nr:[protein-PII] uridylyltransferase [Terriglobales bacterium]